MGPGIALTAVSRTKSDLKAAFKVFTARSQEKSEEKESAASA
jgi:hypothetical protein